MATEDRLILLDERKSLTGQLLEVKLLFRTATVSDYILEWNRFLARVFFEDENCKTPEIGRRARTEAFAR
jgi:hypothetical protein